MGSENSFTIYKTNIFHIQIKILQLFLEQYCNQISAPVYFWPYIQKLWNCLATFVLKLCEKHTSRAYLPNFLNGCKNISKTFKTYIQYFSVFISASTNKNTALLRNVFQSAFNYKTPKFICPYLFYKEKHFEIVFRQESRDLVQFCTCKCGLFITITTLTVLGKRVGESTLRKYFPRRQRREQHKLSVAFAITTLQRGRGSIIEKSRTMVVALKPQTYLREHSFATFQRGCSCL